MTWTDRSALTRKGPLPILATLTLLVSACVAQGPGPAGPPTPTPRPGEATATPLPAPPPGQCHFTDREDAVTSTGRKPGRGDAVIKAVTNDGGEKIYYVPGMRRYPAVRVDAAKGDRWACSEQEAMAAGYRASAELRDPLPTATLERPAPTARP